MQRGAGRAAGETRRPRGTSLPSLPAYDSWCGVAHGCTRKIGLKICGKSARPRPRGAAPHPTLRGTPRFATAAGARGGWAPAPPPRAPRAPCRPQRGSAPRR